MKLNFCNYVLENSKNQIIRRYQHKWRKPEGYNTGIQIYNHITKNKEPFIIKNKNLITWYTCGPTVYDSSHVGHASCYVKLDIIQKILRNHFNYNVINVMNITDIDDKIIKKSIDLQKPFTEVTEKYTKEFWSDLKNLNVEKPNIVIKVTDNIKLVIEFIKQLERNGEAYVGKDGTIYFDVLSYGNYGKFKNLLENEHEQEKNKYKKCNADFALWKLAKESEPSWDSPWGPGRPGWHIECSTLASHVLGSNIDVHAGGLDLRFPHHENEEAQSCAFHKTDQWVNYWIHTGSLHLNSSEKMSKSIKNTVSIEEMLKTTTSDSFRIACAMSHYRSNMEYSSEMLKTAENVLSLYKNFLNSCEDFKKGYVKANVDSDVLNSLLLKLNVRINEAYKDDFNTSAVVKILNEVISVTNSMLNASSSPNSGQEMTSVAAVENFVVKTLKNIGVSVDEREQRSDSDDFNEIMDVLNTFRQNVRIIGLQSKSKDLLELCDSVRDELKNKGVTVKDHGKCSSWSR